MVTEQQINQLKLIAENHQMFIQYWNKYLTSDTIKSRKQTYLETMFAIDTAGFSGEEQVSIRHLIETIWKNPGIDFAKSLDEVFTQFQAQEEDKILTATANANAIIVNNPCLAAPLFD